MKNLIISFFTLLSTILSAQSFQSIAIDDIESNLSHLTDKGILQDSIIIVSGVVNNKSCYYHKLFAYHKDGRSLWSTKGSYDVLHTDSNYIYTAGYYIGNDDVSMDEQLVISKYDKNGNEIFRIGYPEMPYNGYFEEIPNSIDVTSNGSILISSSNAIFTVDANGSNIHKLSTINDDITSIHATNSSSSYLIQTSKNIQTFNQLFTFQNPIVDVKIKDNTIFALFNSYLLEIDQNTKTIDTIFSNQGNCRNIELDNDIWIQVNQLNGIQLIKIDESGASKELNFPTLANDIEFLISKEHYIFVGNSLTKQIGLYTFSRDGDNFTTPNLPDIELIDFYGANKIEDPNYPIFGYYFNPVVVVKNNGEDTLNSFSVFSKLEGGMNCAKNILYQQVTDIKLAPNQTDTFMLAKREYHLGYKVCIQLLAPNSQLETNADDNYFCQTMKIVGKNEVIEDTNIKVYPNPATNFLIIENLNATIKNIEIIDNQGTVLITKNITDQSIKFDISQLKTGIYLFKIYTEEDFYTKKIIKE